LKISVYDLDLERAIEKINKEKLKFVGIQIPEGLKIHVFKILDFFRKNTDAEYIICGDPCYGACDLVDDQLINIGVELLVHIGHTEIPAFEKTKIPVLFINAVADLDINEVIKKAIPSLNGKKIGITTTAQHINVVDEVCKILKENGFEAIVEKGDKRTYFPGQILGCNFSSATKIKDKVDMFLYIGSGNFHPLGMMISTDKDVIVCDPYTKKVTFRELSDFKDMTLRQRYGAITRSKNSKNFGIIISYKKGQNRFDLAKKLKKIVEDKGKKAYFISVDYLNPSNLESFREIDCLVSTACPRIAIDDYMSYKKPIITPVELEIALGLKDWDEYTLDEILNR